MNTGNYIQLSGRLTADVTPNEGKTFARFTLAKNFTKEGKSGNRTRAKVVKNKVAPPFKEAEFDIIYGEGISKVGSLIDVAVMYNIINKSGAWFSYEEQRIGQGRENVKAYLKEHPELIEEIDAKVRAAVKEKIK